MSDIFNIKRFGKYFLSDLKSAYSNFGLSFALICTMEVIVYLFCGLITMFSNGTWSGIDLPVRAFILLVSLMMLVITMPAKCYGHITDKQAGSLWLTIPVSLLEKFLSMILITCLVIPALFGVLFLFFDWAICTIDQSCGDSYVKLLGTIPEVIRSIPELEIENFIHQISNPFLYIDDLVGGILIFLLGALCFKTNKNVKTIITLIAISMGVSMISGPIVMWYISHYSGSGFEELLMDPSSVLGLSLFKNSVLWDTINDLVIMTGLMIAVYFRLKTIKH